MTKESNSRKLAGDPQLTGESGQRNFQLPTPAQERGARILTWVFAMATLLGLILTVMQWLAVISPVPYMVLGALNLPVSPSLASVALLALVTGALIRRKRIALVLVAVLQVLGVFGSVLNLLDAAEVGIQETLADPLTRGFFVMDVTALVVGVSTLVLAWWMRAAFPGRTRARSTVAAMVTLVVGALLTVAMTHVILLISTESASDDGRVLVEAINRGLGIYSPNPQFRHQVPDWLPGLVSVLLALTLVAAVFMFLRSSSKETTWTPRQEVVLRTLLAQYGDQDSLGYFATRRDKNAVFSPDGHAAITYRVVGQVCLASGDPVGDRASWPAAVKAWLGHARYYGWTPAVTSASADGARAFASQGMGVLVMGDEAVLHPERFSLANSSMTNVRRAVRHARQRGLEVEITRHDALSAEALAELGTLADQWRGDEPDRGFSMALNRWGDPADGECTVVVARDEHGQVKGLLSFVPWGRRGLSLDVMRRSPDAPNGTTELMVSELMHYGAARGTREVSLNFAMLRGVFADAEELGAGVITRFNSSVLGFLDRFFQLESLYRANAKYLPEWFPRYACFDSVLSLPRMASTTAQVEGFLPSPFVRSAPDRQLDDAALAAIRELDHEPPRLRELAPRRSQQTRHRLRHARALAEAGIAPYPVGSAPAESVAQLMVEREAGEAASSSPVRVSGRIRKLRDHGGVLFMDLTDAGRTVQVVLDRERMDDTWSVLRANLDSGDLVVVDGEWGVSRNGTESVIARHLTMASKALQPVPWESFEDPEARLRKRSTDLLVHPGKLELLKQRSLAMETVRDYLTDQGFREVETPVLNTVHGGASARPFKTFINAYGMDLSLRIAPELYLKRLLVAGSGPIFEISRNFRNEGADATHNPEFTSLEAYLPYSDYMEMKRLTEALIKQVAEALHGSAVLPLRDVHDPDAPPVLTDVSGPWPVVTVTEAVSRVVGQDVSIHTDFETLLTIAADHGVEIGPGMGPGAVLEELYGELVEPLTIEPTFYCDFPLETSPLTAPHRSEEGLVERWDLVANGMELGTAYSEMTDPVEQRRRLTEQSLKAAAGDVEAMEVDEDFLYALETGMPPAGGLGIGLDRLVMLMTDTTIRDVLSFPFVRPQKK